MIKLVRMAGLSLRLLRLGGRRAWTSAGLVGAGVAVGTMLLAVAVGALHGWDEREARIGWRTDVSLGDASGASAAAIVHVNVRSDRVADRQLDLVDLVDPRPGTTPPPGLPRMPAPGEMWVSPALAKLLTSLPADQLADRLPPGGPTGTIESSGLRDPDELVAIIGRAGPDPEAVPVLGFGASPGFGPIEVYRQLTYVAVALLAFPVVSLLGASARLTAARRVERLAMMRLLGASTGQITVVAVTEVTAVATVAALIGVGAQWLLAPALSDISLGGSGWFPDDLRPPLLVAAAIVVGVALLATVAAVGGMRQVVIGPLGAVRRQRAGSASMMRLLAVVVGLGVFTVANGLRNGAPQGAAGLFLAIGVLAMFGTVAVIGPLVVRLLGRGMTRSARSPARLLAGRRLLDDPKGAFRPLAGLTLAVFVAGFLAPLTAALSTGRASDDVALRLHPQDARPAAVAADATARLDALGIAAQVTPDRTGALVVPGPGVERDRVRTALAPIAAGTAVLTSKEADEQGLVLAADVTRGVMVVLIATFLIAATSTGTAAAARVLDQRRTLRLMRLAGVPLPMFDAARRAETIRPLLVLSGIALACGLLCASPFTTAAAALEPGGLLLLGAVLTAGVALVIAASAASRPLLRSVTTGPDRD